MCVCDLSASPPLSMGGAIAARAAAGGVVKSLAGLVVIDVVEGEGSFTPVLPPSFVSFPLSPLSPPSYSVSFPSLFALAVPLPPSSSHPPTHSPLAPYLPPPSSPPLFLPPLSFPSPFSPFRNSNRLPGFHARAFAGQAISVQVSGHSSGMEVCQCVCPTVTTLAPHCFSLFSV